MSANIGLITGEEEIPISFEDGSTYATREMLITRFSGGSRGPMIQINIGREYIQLNNKAVEDLKAVLADWKNAPEID